MDLLKGYGSDSSSSSSSTSGGEDDRKNNNNNNANPNAQASAVAVAPPRPSLQSTNKALPKKGSAKKGGCGKRILSLGAVLPPEIFDRLTRPPEEDDSSTSSFEGDGSGAQSSKKRKRRSDTTTKNSNEGGNQSNVLKGGADRSELNSLLSELRATPLHVTTKKGTASATKATDGASMKKNDSNNNDDSSTNNGKLGMAFMSFTSSTTTTKKANEVVDVHAPRKQSSAQSVNKKSATTSESQTVMGGGNKKSPPLPPKPAMPSFSRISTAAPVAPTYARSNESSQYSQQHVSSDMPQYPVDDETADYNTKQAPDPAGMTSQSTYANNNNHSGPKSRKQKREEERALRSGQAFQDPSSAVAASEIYQPSPTEFAPTAHAAAIASRAARARGVAAGGGGSVKNIAMYDPSSGTDVKGLGVTGKHRSKHQINQLMASAISLEAHRASEAELARFGAGTGGGSGGGGKGSRVDAKRKYGW